MISQIRQSPTVSPLSLLEGIGRAMMDFGFGAFLEKFEAHFGKRPTKVLLILIGLAIVAATTSLIAISKENR